MKLKTPGFCFSGFLIMMLMPRLINGLEKSMTRSLMDEMVSGAMARSASCKHTAPREGASVSGRPVYIYISLDRAVTILQLAEVLFGGR